MNLLHTSCCDTPFSRLNHKKTCTVGLVGNPNSGKTTIFNALTGGHQRVGNWPGVTVERKSGFLTYDHHTVEVIDLPGVYSLIVSLDHAALDERLACDFILSKEADVIINIVDANNLERNLYLTTQLIEMQIPVIIAVNMMDVAKQAGLQIALDVLAKKLGCSVIALEAHRGKGMRALKQAIVSVHPLPQKLNYYPVLLQTAITDLSTALNGNEWLAMRLLEEDVSARQRVSLEVLSNLNRWQTQLHEEFKEDADILLADARYCFIQQLLRHCVKQTSFQKNSWTHWIDRIVLNRLLGIPIFLGVMYSLFLFAINIGGAFQDFFDISSNTLFVEGVAHLLSYLGASSWLIALLANGVGKGINTTVTFIPVIGALFLFLALLEDSGYMARAAFVVDRFMRFLGLPGKSFVPMIVGFGCNVPAVMAARTLENPRDRILTVMMSPFMSCGARLAIFAVFTAAFFPTGGQNVVFVLYLIGIGMAMLTGWILRKTTLQGEPAPLVLELPPYHLPNLKTIGLHAWQRLQGFVFRAGKLIVPICVLIGVLSSLTMKGSLVTGDGDTHSVLSFFGQWMTPLFSPMGIQADNWPATVGLLTGVLAKEVVIGTLNTLYSQLGNITDLQTQAFSVWGNLHDAWISIPTNLSQIGSSLGNPILAEAPVHLLSQSVYGMMYQRFDGQVGAMAYLLFVLLYFPCVSTTAAMLREVSRGWTYFSVAWTTLIAYCTAVSFYQIATWMRHPMSSSIWIVSMIGLLGIVLMMLIMKGWSHYEPIRS